MSQTVNQVFFVVIAVPVVTFKAAVSWSLLVFMFCFFLKRKKADKNAYLTVT